MKKLMIIFVIMAIFTACNDTEKEKEGDTPVFIEKITIPANQKSLEMWPGDTKTLSFTVLPAALTEKTAKWSSNNTAVAAVNENTGQVTAVSYGTAIITVTSNALDSNNDPKTDTATVKVVNLVSIFNWNADTDTELADIGISDPDEVFSATGPSLIGGKRVFNNIIMQNYIWTGEINASNFAPNPPGPMKSIQANAVLDGITLGRGGYILSERASPCLQIGSDVRGRTTAGSTADNLNGQFDFSSKKFKVIVKYTATKSNTVGNDGEEFPAIGTDASRVAEFMIGVAYNTGATAGTAGPWPFSSGGGEAFAVTRDGALGTMLTLEKIFDPENLSAVQKAALVKGFITLRVSASNNGGRVVVHSVEILQSE